MAKVTSFSFETFIYFLLLILFSPKLCDATNYTIVKSLPGYPGDLPFKLETGYIGVGENEQIQLFYYFIESERDVEKDPLLIWLTGGPGCSALSGLILEIGPLTLNAAACNSTLEIPPLQLNPYSWTKVASIIFLDSPIGTGFSYATTPQAYYYSDDILQSTQIHEFLRKWLINHQKFIKNPFYVTGDSYSGITVPIIVQEILNGNEKEILPKINLKGYALGNPMTNIDTKNAQVKYGHRVSFLSDELYENAKASCKGDFTNVEANNKECHLALETISNDIYSVNKAHILEPKCFYTSLKPYKSRSLTPRYTKEDRAKFLHREIHDPKIHCRELCYFLIENWANNQRVQNALQIRQGTIDDWIRCNFTMLYTTNVQSSFIFHKNLTKRAMRALIYSGDQDYRIPYVDTVNWIQKLKVQVNVDWQPWFVNRQVAGFVTEYSNNHYHLTFTTIKGGGHTAPEFKPQECFAMIDRWLSLQDL